VSEELPKDLPPDRKVRKKKVKQATEETIKTAVESLKEGKASEPIKLTEEPKPYKTPGRKSKLTPETQAKIIEGISKGGTLKMSALAAGVDENTAYDWIKYARQYEETQEPRLKPYHDFRMAIQKAEQDCNLFYVEKLKERAAVGDTKAIAFHLERRASEAYAPKGTGTTENNVHLHLSDDAVKQLTEAWLKKREEPSERIVDVQVTKMSDDVNTASE
jgi:hypothetical protein